MTTNHIVSMEAHQEPEIDLMRRIHKGLGNQRDSAQALEEAAAADHQRTLKQDADMDFLREGTSRLMAYR